MTELVCNYPGDRDAALVTFVYDDESLDSGDRAAFGAHLATCEVCQDEVDALRGVRAQLGRWNPPAPNFAIAVSATPGPLAIHHEASAINHQPSRGSRWWREIPAWAQVAAALLFLGISAGLANLDVRYDQQGLSIRTGWSQPRDARASAAPAAAVAGSSPADAPWKADLTALERQLRAEMRVTPTATEQARAAAARGSDADIRRVRALVDESEKRQQRELALRLAELLRDVNVQRQADLAKVNRALGAVENNLGVEVLKTRQQVNLMYRASQVVR
ncbi:MAG TPA: hypothetical protein VKE51_28025 [Vicinamibacterales bacterium]|nr:hypothetical protein [Vicinamibacterales bacterium]